MLTSGESDTFTLNYLIEGMNVTMLNSKLELVWNDAFVESTIQKIDGTVIDVIIDPNMTASRNK